MEGPAGCSPTRAVDAWEGAALAWLGGAATGAKSLEAADKAAKDYNPSKPVQEHPEEDLSLTPAVARIDLPKLVGMRVSKDRTYYYRWKMEYPATDTPALDAVFEV